MDVGRRRKVVETVYDKPLPLKGKPEVRKGKGDRKGTLLWLCCSIQPFAMAGSYLPWVLPCPMAQDVADSLV